MMGDLDGALGIIAGTLCGAAVGIEREWSGHARGPQARFAGVRTFTLLGGLAGIAGWLWTRDYAVLAAVLLAGAAALIVAAYVAASRRNVEGTTEVAALVVLAAGLLAGANHLALASGITAVANLVLVEKSRLHGMVARLADTEIKAGARFAVMAVVILPLLPPGPYGPFGGIRPRELWAFVLLFSGLSFAGYIARRAVGGQQGYAVAGLLGGLISSTSVTFSFAQLSRREPEAGQPLALGVAAASTLLFVRLLAGTVVLNPALASALLPYLVPPCAVGAVVVAAGLLWVRRQSRVIAPPTNPLQFWASLQMALVFQIVLFGVAAVRQSWGDSGVLASGVVLGFADLDALTISMAKSAAAGVPARVAAQAIAIGVVSNTAFKMAVALALGHAEFRRWSVASLAVLGVASAVAIALVR